MMYADFKFSDYFIVDGYKPNQNNSLAIRGNNKKIA